MIGEGVINSNNHGFPNIIEIEKEKSSSRAQNFCTSQYLHLGLLELFCDGMSENWRDPKITISISITNTKW